MQSCVNIKIAARHKDTEDVAALDGNIGRECLKPPVHRFEAGLADDRVVASRPAQNQEIALLTGTCRTPGKGETVDDPTTGWHHITRIGEYTGAALTRDTG